MSHIFVTTFVLGANHPKGAAHSSCLFCTVALLGIWTLGVKLYVFLVVHHILWYPKSQGSIMNLPCLMKLMGCKLSS